MKQKHHSKPSTKSGANHASLSTGANVAIAALASKVSASNEIQLLPAGKFRATDGRPKGIDAWFIDADIAVSLIAQVEARESRIVIDYEHQSLRAAQNGQPAPAAGWFKKLEWREGDGLYAVDVEWTETARAHIEAKEYLYISPVFLYDKTGAVNKIVNAAITNNPALDGMDEVALMAASQLLADQSHMEALTMNIEEILANIRWLLNLPTLATADEVLAELQKAVSKIKEALPEEAAATFDLLAHLEKLDSDLAAAGSEIVALKDATPDPALYVPVETMKAVQDELAALQKQVNDEEVDGLVTAALSDAKLLPAQEAWARELGGKDIGALRAYLDTAQPIAALTKTQTGGKQPGATGEVDLTDDELAICTQMGITPEEYKKTKEATAGA